MAFYQASLSGESPWPLQLLGKREGLGGSVATPSKYSYTPTLLPQPAAADPGHLSAPQIAPSAAPPLEKLKQTSYLSWDLSLLLVFLSKISELPSVGVRRFQDTDSLSTGAEAQARLPGTPGRVRRGGGRQGPVQGSRRLQAATR